jgi:DNA-directed RNA polymerase subunit M/transcription elongation factor TFIIS
MSAICPECDSTLDLEEDDAEVGDELSCSECGALLRVSSESPLELELADDDDLDEEEEEEDEGDDDDDDLDEDEDEDEGVEDDE